MSDRTPGSAAAAVGAHSKDAMQAGAAPPGTRSEEPLRDAASEAASTLHDGAAAASRSATALGREAHERSAEAGRFAGRVVRQDPLWSLLAAGAVGFAIGMMVGRR